MPGRDHWMARLKPIGASSVIPFQRTLAPMDAERLRAGLWPQDMDGRWGMFLDSTALQMFRSWSGHCIYSLPAAPQPDGSIVLAPLHVNSDAAVYRRSQDVDEVRIASSLIDAALHAKA